MTKRSLEQFERWWQKWPEVGVDATDRRIIRGLVLSREVALSRWPDLKYHLPADLWMRANSYHTPDCCFTAYRIS